MIQLPSERERQPLRVEKRQRQVNSEETKAAATEEKDDLSQLRAKALLRARESRKKTVDKLSEPEVASDDVERLRLLRERAIQSTKKNGEKTNSTDSA